MFFNSQHQASNKDAFLMERKDVIKMDTVIKVKCIDQTLTLINSPVIASGGLNENKLECDFCEKWNGFSKTAVFYQDKKNVYYSVLDENDTCIIPKEATASKGTMFFGIFGSKDGVTRTSEILRYKIDEGAITEDLKPSDPTPDIYEQILAKLQEIREAETTFETNITQQQNNFETKITNQQNNYETDLSGQWSTYKTETDEEIAEKLSKVYRPCGSVANYDALPKNAEVGDVYNLLDTGVNYAWTGTEWDSLAGIIDISNFYNKTEVDTKLNAETTNRTNADNTLQGNIDQKVNIADIVNNLTSSDANKPLSANQGKVLKDLIDQQTVDQSMSATSTNAIANKVVKEYIDNGTFRAIHYTDEWNSISQFTNNGFFHFDTATSAIATATSGENFSSYTVGDFYCLALGSVWNSPYLNWATVFVTSPRLEKEMWVCRIWDGAIVNWSRVSFTSMELSGTTLNITK